MLGCAVGNLTTLLSPAIGEPRGTRLGNLAQATAHNVCLLLNPRGILQEALTGNPQLPAGLFAAQQTGDTDHGTVYGSGLHQIDPKELADIPAALVAERLDLRRQAKVPRPPLRLQAFEHLPD